MLIPCVFFLFIYIALLLFKVVASMENNNHVPSLWIRWLHGALSKQKVGCDLAQYLYPHATTQDSNGNIMQGGQNQR